jgi:hypothetical protein
MTRPEMILFLQGCLVGLKKAKELFRGSTDAKGGCKVPSQGNACRCFLCVCDEEILKAEGVIKQ